MPKQDNAGPQLTLTIFDDVQKASKRIKVSVAPLCFFAGYEILALLCISKPGRWLLQSRIRFRGKVTALYHFD